MNEFRKQLGLFFRTLRKNGYFAKQNHTCCSTCGWAEVPESKKDKAVFYHYQDAALISSNSCVYLCWSGDGKEIVKLARKVGLKAEWDGSEKTRICVGIGVKK